MLSARLAYLRKLNNKKQEDMANYLGISRPAYTAYESGRRQPDYAALQKLADFFKVSTDYLLGRCDTREIDLVDVFEYNADNLKAAGKPVTPEQRTEILKILDQDNKPQPEPPPQRKKVDLSDMVIAADIENRRELVPISDELRAILEDVIEEILEEREQKKRGE